MLEDKENDNRMAYEHKGSMQNVMYILALSVLTSPASKSVEQQNVSAWSLSFWMFFLVLSAWWMERATKENLSSSLS